MATTYTLHVTARGHKCRKPASITVPASYIRAGEALSFGKWDLYHIYGRYIVALGTGFGYKGMPVYEFTNFNCAAAKLVEEGSK